MTMSTSDEHVDLCVVLEYYMLIILHANPSFVPDNLEIMSIEMV